MRQPKPKVGVREMPKLFCKKCGREWVPRVPSPEKCPHCAQPNWWIPKQEGKAK